MSLPPGLQVAVTIRDPIWGVLEFTELEHRLIQTPYFQSTRHVNQLALVRGYYPSAVQTRYEHMLETAYLSGECLWQLARHQPDLKITPLHLQLVRLAGLLHDIGHACWSHFFDTFLIQNPDLQEMVCPEMRCHERRGMVLVEFLFDKVIDQLVDEYQTFLVERSDDLTLMMYILRQMRPVILGMIRGLRPEATPAAMPEVTLEATPVIKPKVNSEESSQAIPTNNSSSCSSTTQSKESREKDARLLMYQILAESSPWHSEAGLQTGLQANPLAGPKALPLFMYEIVANKHCELDVDKLAYLTADSRSVGMHQDLQIARLFRHTRVCPRTGHLIWRRKVGNLVSKVFSYRRLMFAQLYQNPETVQQEAALSPVFRALFRILDLPAMLNAYRVNRHKWRLVLTDDMMYSVRQILQIVPEWFRTLSGHEDTILGDAFQAESRLKRAVLIDDYEDEDQEDSEHKQQSKSAIDSSPIQIAHAVRLSPGKSQESDKGPDKSSAASTSDASLSLPPSAQNHNIYLPTYGQTNQELRLLTKYNYANCDFHPAYRLHTYRDPKRLDQTVPLSRVPAFERLDMDLHAKPIHRVLVYRVPEE